MNNIKLHDKFFKPYISEKEIENAVKRIGLKINADYKDETPLFVGVLNGCFMFISDLMKEITIDCEVSFTKLSSYEGTASTGKVNTLIGLNETIEGRTVILVEDIIDTGLTIEKAVNELARLKAKKIVICTLLLKPDAYHHKIPVDYAAIEIPNDFVVGYGLDYDGLGRNLKSIYKISSEM